MGVCDAGAVQQMASNLNIPGCVLELYCGQFGHLPNSIPDLDNWGTSIGARHADGSWTCPQVTPKQPCNDGVVTWDWIDKHLQDAKWGGPYDHGAGEFAAYEGASYCVPQIQGYNVQSPASGGSPPPSGGSSGGSTGGTGSSGGASAVAGATGATGLLSNPLLLVGGAFVAVAFLMR